MKIGILLNNMTGIGGVQKITMEKIDAWIQDFGYEVILITKNQANASFFFSLNQKCKFYDLNIKTKSKFKGGVIPYFKNLSTGLRFYLELKEILKLEAIDILFTSVVGFDSLIVPFVNFKIP